jgi:hypothetical protein
MGEPDPNAKPKPTPRDVREARLAKALRDNLRRRKATLLADEASPDSGDASR